jgi:hypothetical protein
VATDNKIFKPLHCNCPLTVSPNSACLALSLSSTPTERSKLENSPVMDMLLRSLAFALIISRAHGQSATYGSGFVSLESNTTGSPTDAVVSIKLSNGYVGNALEVYDSASGTPKFTLQYDGIILKSSGTFDIPHPLKDDPLERLRHSFVESPLVDNIYTGTVTVPQGDTAVIDLDVKFRMTSGTFQALNFNPRVIATCNGCIAAWGFAGAELSVWCAAHCEDELQHEITYQVVAERHDQQILDSEMTGPDKHLIPEYTMQSR